MAKVVKVRFLQSWGSPVDGSIIRRHAVVDLPEFWANKFTAEGIAEPVTSQPKTDPKKKK